MLDGSSPNADILLSKVLLFVESPIPGPSKGAWNFFAFKTATGGSMAGRNPHNFLKRQKEVKRKEEAALKMARRQGKTERPKDTEDEERAQEGL